LKVDATNNVYQHEFTPAPVIPREGVESIVIMMSTYTTHWAAFVIPREGVERTPYQRKRTVFGSNASM